MNPSENKYLPRYDVIIVTVAVALFALVGLLGSIHLIEAKAESGSVALISGLTGTALGALASMLVSTSNKNQMTQPVEIANTPANPVPTADVPPASQTDAIDKPGRGTLATPTPSAADSEAAAPEDNPTP